MLSASSSPSPRSPGAPGNPLSPLLFQGSLNEGLSFGAAPFTGKICSRKGLLVRTDGVAGRAGNPRAPVAPSSDLPAGSKDHSQVSSPGSVTRGGCVPPKARGRFVLQLTEVQLGGAGFGFCVQ